MSLGEQVARRTLRLFIAIVLACAVPLWACADDNVASEFLARYCVACHGAAEPEGGLRLDNLKFEWKGNAAAQWEKVLRRVAEGDMPPEDAQRYPTVQEQANFLGLLRASFVKAKEEAAVGGTLLRRLNRVEYENTIRDVFGFTFRTPMSFPPDTELHGFDNTADGLVLSPPLMKQYLEAATVVADRVAPPLEAKVVARPVSVDVAPEGFERNFSATFLHEDRLRVVSSYEIFVRSCTWPSRFEAQSHGRYRVIIRASAFRPQQEALKLELRARPSTSNVFTSVYKCRKLAKFEISEGDASEHTCEVDLLKGETILIRYANSSLRSIDGDKQPDPKIYEVAFADKRFHAAWLQMKLARGTTAAENWQRLKSLMAEVEVDPDDERLKALPKLSAQVRGALDNILAHQRNESGPALDIHRAAFSGPIGPLQDERLARIAERQPKTLLPKRNGESDREYVEAYLRSLLRRAFRRPVDDEIAEKYTEAAIAHAQQRGRVEDGLHLAIRGDPLFAGVSLP